MLRASVTIATWNRREILGQLLEALVHQTVPASEYEVIVCDSDSTDGTREAVSILAAQHANIRYIDVPLNNLAAKRNAGIRAANSEIVIFMDDDAVPETRFIESHVRAHKGTEDVVFCGQIRYPDAWIRRSNYFRYRDSRHLGAARTKIRSDNVPPWMITVMNLSFKRSEIAGKVGDVSEEFKRYGGEDTEFGFRIVAAGIRLVYLPEALVTHYEYGGSIDKYYRKLYVCARDSAPILLEHVPEFRYVTKGRHLEQIYSNRGVGSLLLRALASICTLRWSVRLLIRLLESTDGMSWLYSKCAYLYLSSVAIVAGIADRSSQRQGSMWFD
jgi:glycosyltransferase involved in cell wall biosynthesis